MVLDIVFSLDSVITAVGMADDIGVMVSAVVVTVGIMLFAAGPIGEFVQRHPTVKMLALSFLLLIGLSLLLEGFDFGVGMLMIPFGIAGKGEPEQRERRRRAALNTIGPVWDANEVWLITAGAAMFAAFPV